MPNTLDETRWDLLLRRISKGECTPFIGAGACAGHLPLGSEISTEWAKKLEIPVNNDCDLAAVAQAIAVEKGDAVVPKEYMQDIIRNAQKPDFFRKDQPHAFLADLPLPIYITTNYDNFMCEALKAKNKDARRELCRWNKATQRLKSVFTERSYKPQASTPLVFHLHGYAEVVDSLVLTEDDYLDFLVSIKPGLLPKEVEQAFTTTTLLFLGYKLADWDFRVLFRSLVDYLQRCSARAHISVQILPLGDSIKECEREETRRRIQGHLDTRFQRMQIWVYWGTCAEFIADLSTRWEAYKNANHP